MKIAILGAGAYGTALGGILTENGYIVSYFDPLVLKTSLEEVLKDASYIVLAVPSKAILETLKNLPTQIPLIVTTKGILEPKIFEKFQEVMVLSGPGFAKDLKNHQKTYLTITDPILKELFRANYIEFDFTTDIKGVLLCGALKNVYALIAGRKELVRDTKKWHDFIEKALSEIKEILAFNGADPQTANLFCGVDDLKLTAAPPSRNYAYGMSLTRHQTPPENATVEGVTILQEIKKGTLKIPESATMLRQLLIANISPNE